MFQNCIAIQMFQRAVTYFCTEHPHNKSKQKWMKIIHLKLLISEVNTTKLNTSYPFGRVCARSCCPRAFKW